MKTKFQLTRIFNLIFFGWIIFQNSFGQESYIKNRLNFKAGYARYTTGMRGDKKVGVGNYRIETNYGILKYFETGAYIGYSRFDYYRPIEVDSFSTSYSIEGNNTFFYGANCNFHPLTFLIKKDAFRFDLYLTGKFGGVYFSKPLGPHQEIRNHFAEYSIGAGLSYYLGKHLGLFLEYSYGKYVYGDKNKLRYGLTLKF